MDRSLAAEGIKQLTQAKNVYVAFVTCVTHLS